MDEAISLSLTPVYRGWIGRVETEKGSYEIVFGEVEEISNWIKDNLRPKI